MGNRKTHKHSAVINRDGTVSIDIGRGHTVILDTVDLPKIEKHKWSLVPSKSNSGYAKATIRRNGKATCVLMQHLIKDRVPGKEIDHIDRNKLNNTRGNLRYVNHSINMANLPLFKNNKSGIPGVCWLKGRGVWQVTCGATKKNGSYRPKYVGTFKNFEEAKLARKKAEKSLTRTNK